MVELTFPWKVVVSIRHRGPQSRETEVRAQDLIEEAKKGDYAESKRKIQVEAKKIRACMAGSMSISLEIPVKEKPE